MRIHVILALCAPISLMAQTHSPFADAFRVNAKQSSANIIAALQEMPADRYGYKPTPAQMSVGKITTHLVIANSFMCSAIGGVTAPPRSDLAETDTKDRLVAALRGHLRVVRADVTEFARASPTPRRRR